MKKNKRNMKRNCDIGEIVVIRGIRYKACEKINKCCNCAFQEPFCVFIDRPRCLDGIIFERYETNGEIFFNKNNHKKQNTMNTNLENVALIAEPRMQVEVDFENLKKNRNMSTIMGIPVDVDKVFYNLDGETVVGISGLMSIRGVKIRGVWDIWGNILEFKKSGFIFGWEKYMDKLYDQTTPQMFSLVMVKKLES